MIVALVGLGTVAVAWFAAAVTLHATGRQPHGEGPFDALVVAGAAVRPDGTPSGALARRIEHAVALWRAGVAGRIVLTGGLGRSGRAEGAVAADEARRLGVPGTALLVEDASTSTEENASGAARLLGPCRVLVVTDSYHALRCRLVFARHFPHAEVATSSPPLPTAIRLALREVVVLAIYAMTGRLRPVRSPPP